ncbi:hypothetical protein JRO89_XS02G0106700 [Xanthoceras sorbifolium]|uniref:Uncharacterized protein n=1 Tax=Xanthoceras sorbifolium TaxID=99658 RepID=A0ABQ8IFY0_9ROSI|nr:hypothetical protein JRO89_XS02G0106700 [Xanthoceras sorbifolium]
MVNNRKDEASRSAVNSPSNTPTSNQAQLAALEADRVEIHEGQAELRREMAQLIDRVDRIERKKNALLRIQKPFFRNKDDEESHYSGYFDEMNSSSYRDNDQFRPISFHPVTPSGDGCELRIKDLLLANGNGWGLQAISQVFWRLIVILSFQFLCLGQVCNDKLIWHFDKRGNSTIKSAFRLVVSLSSPVACSICPSSPS